MIAYSPVIHTITYRAQEIGVLRLDLLHRDISGNKWFKLKYNILAAIDAGKTGLLTFGGAYSNHIAATAAACKMAGLKSIGMIRGDETTALNATLQKAMGNGMKIHWIDRARYSQKEDADFLKALQAQYPEAYIVPEGGNNDKGICGCAEILSPETLSYKTICCAIGTGATFEGIRQSLQSSQFLVGIPVLKGFEKTNHANAETHTGYHFGGYAKHTPELLAFKDNFENTYRIPLDYVYTAKLFYAVFDLIDKGLISRESSVLIIHSGGLQGNAGYEARYSLKPSRQLMDAQG